MFLVSFSKENNIKLHDSPFCNSPLDLHDIESPAVGMWSDLQRTINMILSLIAAQEIISLVGYFKGQWTPGPKLYWYMQLYPTTQANLYFIIFIKQGWGAGRVQV